MIIVCQQKNAAGFVRQRLNRKFFINSLFEQCHLNCLRFTLGGDFCEIDAG